MQTGQLALGREQREQVISYLPASEKAELQRLARQADLSVSQALRRGARLWVALTRQEGR